MDESVDAVRAIMANPRFQELVATRRRLSWSMTIIMFLVYFGFILLVAFNKTDGGIISQRVGGGTTSIAIANSKFDRMTAELRQEIGR